MEMWHECKLGDVITLKRGYDLPQRDRLPGLFPIVSSSGVTDYNAIAKVKGPGVVTGRYGTLGEVFYIEGAFWPLNTSLYVQEFKGNDPRFIAYFLKNLNLGTKNSAGAVPGVNRNHIHAIDVCVPPLAVQQRISSVLSAYDDLIENNQRRIRILEEMARSLYREWFVKFRFPGHENHRMVDSALGKIPGGWEVKRLDQLAEIRGGKQLEKENIYAMGEFPVFGGNGIQGYSGKATHCGFVIAFGRVGAYCGSIHWSYGGAWLNNNSSSVVPMEYDELVLHHLLHFNFSNLRGGAAQPFISNSALGRIELVLPRKTLAESFCSLAKPLRLQQVALEHQIQNLRRTRDLLLPRLLSGQIEVDTA